MQVEKNVLINLKINQMKTIKTIFSILLFSYFLSFESYCQTDNIVADSKPFQYLIGMEYSEVSELGDFDSNSSSSTTYPNGDKSSSANLIQGGKQIITSEKSWLDKNTNKEIHKILDVIVLNGKYSICGGCLLSKNKNNRIKSIYPFGTINDDSILVAFEVNGKTGKFKKVNPEKLKRNPNYLKRTN
jgi:hypothetical protein